MKLILAMSILTGLMAKAKPSDKSLFDFSAKTADGKEQNLGEYKDKVTLVVNVASKCGYTPQYDGLEKVYKQYSDKGFVVLGFPSNQFGGQEPGTNQEIQKFCKANFGVTFPIFAKVDVNGDKALPVYEWLKSSAPGVLGSEAIKWNFTKFLVGRDGKVLARFAPQTKPEDITAQIEKALAVKPVGGAN